MKKAIPFLLALALTACEQSKAPKKIILPTVETLASEPDRLKDLRQQCKTDRTNLGDELCNRVAEATNLRFLGYGKTPYMPPKESPKF